MATAETTAEKTTTTTTVETTELECLKKKLQTVETLIKVQDDVLLRQKEILKEIIKEVNSIEQQIQITNDHYNHHNNLSDKSHFQSFSDKIKTSVVHINKQLQNAQKIYKEMEQESKNSSEPILRYGNRVSFSSMVHDTVAILDGGAQYAKVIDRRIRECDVQSVILPFVTKWEDLKGKYKAIVISGGPSSVYAKESPKCDPRIFTENTTIPVLGICYGFQLMAFSLEGKVEKGHEREDGQFQLQLFNHQKSILYKDIPEDDLLALLTHGDSVLDPGKSMFITSKSSNGVIASAEHEKLPFYGVQYHPEVDLTTFGPMIFRNFLFKIANCKPSFTAHNRKEAVIEILRACIKERKVLAFVSGGVDSSVCTALLRQALDPKQIFCVHVDTGFMRKNESRQVKKALEDIGVDVLVLDESERFLNSTTEIDGVSTKKLCECTNPEHKRKIIGNVFMKIYEDIVCNQLKLKMEDIMLAQGTLRPDLIESASQDANRGNTAEVIKTHHNDTELVRKFRASGRVVEPLTEYHKDEVRALGTELGLPKHLVWRQPFPGPGLAIRILCATEPYCTDDDENILKQLKIFETDAIAICLLGVRTVGVQGDGRSYSHCVALTLKNPNAKKPWKDLYKLAKDIPRVVKQVNRCIFLFGNPLSGKQSSITKTLLTKNVIEQLRECDDIVTQLLLSNDLTHVISQVPVVLFPANFGVEGARSICLRPFISRDFMTGVPAVIDTHLPEKILDEMVKNILQVKGITRVAIDLTSKPPGTTEWE